MGHQSLMVPGVAMARRDHEHVELLASEIVEVDHGYTPKPGPLLEEATKDDPGVLFTISHGAGAPRQGWRSLEGQRRFQGGMSFGRAGGLLHGEALAGRPFMPGGMWFMLACFGAGTPAHSKYQRWLEQLASLGSYQTELDADALVEHDPVARRLAAVAVEQERTRGHHLALVSARVEVAGRGVLRVGDAANLADPITGEGIANAVLSGRLVAQALEGARDPAHAQRRWQRSYDARPWPELSAALRLRTLLLGTRRKILAMSLLQRRPRLAERFHGSLEGVVSSRDVLPLRLLEVPLGWPARRAGS